MWWLDNRQIYCKSNLHNFIVNGNAATDNLEIFTERFKRQKNTNLPFFSYGKRKCRRRGMRISCKERESTSSVIAQHWLKTQNSYSLPHIKSNKLINKYNLIYFCDCTCWQDLLDIYWKSRICDCVYVYLNSRIYSTKEGNIFPCSFF